MGVRWAERDARNPRGGSFAPRLGPPRGSTRRSRPRARLALFFLLLLLLQACTSDAAGDLAHAESAFAARSPDAWDLFVAIDPASPEGRAARERLARADARYRAGIDALALGDDESA